MAFITPALQELALVRESLRGLTMFEVTCQAGLTIFTRLSTHIRQCPNLSQFEIPNLNAAGLTGYEDGDDFPPARAD